MKPYPLAEELLPPVLRVAMPRAARLSAPGGTMHVVARCNKREFYFTTPADFEVLLPTCGRWSGPTRSRRPGISPHAGDEEVFPCLCKFKHLEAERCPVPFCGFFSPLTRKSTEPMPFDCERIVDSGLGWLITMEK